MQYIFINNSLETFTVDGSGAIATHVASVRAAAGRAGIEPVVVTTRAPGRVPLDDGPGRGVRPAPRLPRLLLRVVRKVARLRGWQGYEQPWYAHQVRRALRLAGASTDRVLVLHNDPDVAEFLAERFPHDVVVHVWHNVLAHGRAPRAGVRQLTVSSYLARAVADMTGAGTPPDVIPNGVDAAMFRPAETDDGVMTVSFLGRTGIEKGPDLLLRALLEIPDDARPERVLLIGSNVWGATVPDAYQQELEELVDRLDAKGVLVERTGHLGRQRVAEALRSSDIHVVPSRWEDPAPLVLMEAMACGLCVVAARSGGMPEYGGDTVLWFEREDVGGLAAQLDRVLRDSELRDDLRSRARRKAEGLSWDRTWEELRRTAEA